METTTEDPFASGVEAPEEDPFADPAPDPAAEVEGATPPVVNREGEKVAETPAPPAPPAPGPAEAPPADPTPPAPGETPAGPDTPEEQPQQPSPEEQPGPSQEPAPEQGTTPGPRGGKVQTRYYKLLYQTAPTTWEEIALPDGNENVVQKDGTKWVAARNNDHALRLGYVLAGRPDDGVTLFPVPSGAWKPKRVKPKPQVPAKESLDIS